MRELKNHSGLTYRQLEERAAERDEVLARSTLADVLAGKTLPRPDLLAAFVRACGDGERVAVWLEARESVAGKRAAGSGGNGGTAGASATAGTGGPERSWRVVPLLQGLRRVPVALGTSAATLLVAFAAWMVATGDSLRSTGNGGDAPSASPDVSSVTLPGGWVQIRPVTAPRLCLTDGKVPDGRYPSLVAAQRPCDEVAPQNTMLEPMGDNTYRVQWHHPDYGKGCLKALTSGPGASLLEPWDDCRQGSRFRIEPHGESGSGKYLIKVPGGCAGISGSVTTEGAEAVVDRCARKGGQVFTIGSAS